MNTKRTSKGNGAHVGRAVAILLAVILHAGTSHADAIPLLTKVSDTDWFTGSVQYGASVAVDTGTETLRHVVGTNTTLTAWRTHAWGNFEPTLLKRAGERVELSMNVTVDTDAFEFKYVLRLGLLNARGTPGTASANANNHPGDRRNNIGVAFAMSIQSDANDATSFYGHDHNWNNGEIPFSRRDFFAPAQGDGALGSSITATFVPGTTHTYRLSVERSGEEELTIKAWLDGNLLDGGRTLTFAAAAAKQSDLDPAPLTLTDFLTFDEVLLGYTVSSSTQFGIEYGDVKVEYFPVREGTMFIIR